jgi:hypothetical protein
MQPIKRFIGVGLLLAATSSVYAATDSSGVWTTCSSENGTCSFTGTQAVRYGANGKYSAGTFKTKVTCSNAVFGDPIPGIGKTCEVLSPALAPAGYVWTSCANEYQNCAFTGIKAVRYGATTGYYSGSFNATTACSNSVFGDPASGVTKKCDVLAAVVTPTPTPTPTASNSGTTITDASGVWTQCAQEYGTCTFTGTKTVKYGGNGGYLSGSFASSVSCKNSSFGSDPASGVTKACYLLTQPVATTAASTGKTTTPTSATTAAATSGSTTTTSTSTSQVPASGTAWTLCAKLNDRCSFTGTKVVKFSDPGDASRTSYRVHTNGAYCDNYICEINGPIPYLPVSTTPYVNASKIPVGFTGSDVEVSKVATQTANPTEYGPANTNIYVTGGAFRLGCGYTHMNFDDPIKYPGQKGAAKLMTYFGNSLTDYSSTAASIMNTGKSSCQGGPVFNRTAYWGPTMVDTRDGTPLAPSGITTYYKTGDNATKVVPPPSGLRMIAGDDLVLSTTNIKKTVHWHCARPGLDILASGEHDSIPTDCLAGDMYENIVFPVCWDGVNLDSPDHKAHMAYPFVGGSQGGSVNGCPVTHPVLLPSITENIHYTVKNNGDTKYWRLSTDAYPTTTAGGLSASGAWFGGWNVAVMKQLTKTCFNEMRDCHSNFVPAKGNLVDPSLPSYGRDLWPTP